jgi:hypothetical protein
MFGVGSILEAELQMNGSPSRFGLQAISARIKTNNFASGSKKPIIVISNTSESGRVSVSNPGAIEID